MIFYEYYYFRAITPAVKKMHKMVNFFLNSESILGTTNMLDIPKIPYT